MLRSRSTGCPGVRGDASIPRSHQPRPLILPCSDHCVYHLESHQWLVTEEDQSAGWWVGKVLELVEREMQRVAETKLGGRVDQAGQTGSVSELSGSLVALSQHDIAAREKALLPGR